MLKRMNTNQNAELMKSYAVNEIIRKYTQTRVRERVGEEVEIEVPLKITKSKGALWILVVLPMSYPHMAPIIQIINAKVTHEYIDDNFRVVHHTLSEWTKDSSLLAVVEAIHAEFDSTPPQLYKGTKGTVGGGSAKASSEVLKLRKPGLTDLDEKIKNMSKEEIQGVLDDDTFFDDFFMNLDGVKDFYDDFVKILLKMKNKAQENADLKEELDDRVKELEENDYDIDIDEINDKLEEKIIELKEVTSKLKKDFKNVQ